MEQKMLERTHSKADEAKVADGFSHGGQCTMVGWSWANARRMAG